MMKKMIAALVMVACASSVYAEEKIATLDDVMNVVEKNATILQTLNGKANTAQSSLDRIESTARVILAQQNNIFRLEIKKGGSTWVAAGKFAKETGISQKEAMMVIMGANSLIDPANIAEGDVFTSPKPGTDAYRIAMKKGAPMYQAWLDEQAVHQKVASMEMKRFKVTEEVDINVQKINTLIVQVADFQKQVKIKDLTIEDLTVTHKAYIEELEIAKQHVHDLTIDKETHLDAYYKKLHIANLQIDNLAQLLEQAKNKPPVIVTKEVVKYRDASKTVVASGTCGDIPWDATGIWEKFPEGSVGSETQLRTEGPRYKYKLITRKGDKIYATKCFKKENIWSLADLSAEWDVKLSTFKTYGNVGDGGKHSTLVVGIVKKR